MIIEKIEFQSEQNKWFVTLKGNASTEILQLHEDTIVYYELIQGREITSEIYKEIQLFENKQAAIQQALTYLNRRRTGHEVEIFLKLQCNVREETARDVINTLIQQGYINDMAYAQAYTHDQIFFAKKSFSTIKQRLKEKGIHTDTLNELSDWFITKKDFIEAEEQSTLYYIQQYVRKYKNLNIFERNQRIIAKLRQKGYNKHTIQIILQDFAPLELTETEIENLLSKNRKRVAQAKSLGQYLAYMQKYNIDKEILIEFFNQERMTLHGKKES